MRIAALRNRGVSCLFVMAVITEGQILRRIVIGSSVSLRHADNTNIFSTGEDYVVRPTFETFAIRSG